MNTARLGVILRRYRKMRRMTMYQLGLALHLREMTVCRYEKGQQPIPPDLLIVWAAYLGIPWILDEMCLECPIGAAMSQHSPLTAA